MAKMSLTVNGAKETQQMLLTLGNEMPGVSEKSVLAAADVMKSGMQRRIRKSKGPNGGKTAESIEIGNIDRTRDGIKVTVGPSEEGSRRFIARFLEYGTSKMPAYPWRRPTLDEDGDEAVRKARAEIDKAIARVNR